MMLRNEGPAWFVRQMRYELSTGPLLISMPSQINEDDVRDIEEVIAIWLRGVRRCVVEEDAPNRPENPRREEPEA